MFLYWIPRADGAKFAIPDFLDYVKDRGAKLHRREVLSGPEGSGPGWVFAIGEWDVARVTFTPDAQTWMGIHAPGQPEAEGQPARPQHFVGRWNDTPLDPAPLQRPTLLESHTVALEDGTQWAAAVARGFDAEAVHFYTPLPKTLTYDPTSNRWRPRQIGREHRRFLELAIAYGEAHDSAVAAETKAFDFPDVDELAVLALTANYRIGPSELALFEDVYSEKVRDALVSAAMDFPTIIRYSQKKTGEASGSSGS